MKRLTNPANVLCTVVLLALGLVVALDLPGTDAAEVSHIPGRQSYTRNIEDAIRQGGTVYIAPRDEPYVIGPMVIDRPVRIVGYGAAVRVRDDWTDKTRNAIELRAPIHIEGLAVIAGGSYAAIAVKASGCVLTDVQVYDYAYKGVNAHIPDGGSLIVERCYAASGRGNGIKEYDAGGIYPIAYQADAGLDRAAGRLIFRDCVAGPHPGSRGHGPSIKVGSARSVLIEGFRVDAAIDPINGHSVIIGEAVGQLEVRGSELPRGIIHYPDDRSARPSVEVMRVEGCLLGGGTPPTNIHDHVLADRLIYRDTRFRNIDNTALHDASSGSRVFEGCSFEFGAELRASHGRWDGQVHFATAGTEQRMSWRNTEILPVGGTMPRWSLDAARQAQWDNR